MIRTPTGLYAILDLDLCGARSPAEICASVCAVGAGALQLRGKNAATRDLVEVGRALRAETRRRGVLFVVNDRADVALLLEADGVHLGQEDLPVSAARRLLPHGVIGLSTHSVAQVRAAAASGADYLGFGPVFPTGSKRNPDPVQGLGGLAEAVHAASLPVVAIGGITRERAAEVRQTGAAGIAVISDLLSAADVEARARELCEAWG
jgi:thiamine-phosphate diphosphorylase